MLIRDGADLRLLLQVKKFQLLVIAGRGERLAIGREGQGVDGLPVAGQAFDLLQGFAIEQNEGPVLAADRHGLAVRRDGEAALDQEVGDLLALACLAPVPASWRWTVPEWSRTKRVLLSEVKTARFAAMETGILSRTVSGEGPTTRSPPRFLSKPMFCHQAKGPGP